MAKTLEGLIGKGDDSESALDALEQTLGDLIEGILLLSEPRPDHRGDSTETPASELMPLLNRLDALLENYDAEIEAGKLNVFMPLCSLW